MNPISHLFRLMAATKNDGAAEKMARFVLYIKIQRRDMKKDKAMSIPCGQVTLKGVIIVVDWDEDGNSLSIAISTYGEEEYMIFLDRKGKDLFKFIHQLVQVKGKISELEGIKQIKITEIEPCLSHSDQTLSI